MTDVAAVPTGDHIAPREELPEDTEALQRRLEEVRRRWQELNKSLLDSSSDGSSPSSKSSASSSLEPSTSPKRRKMRNPRPSHSERDEKRRTHNPSPSPLLEGQDQDETNNEEDHARSRIKKEEEDADDLDAELEEDEGDDGEDGDEEDDGEVEDSDASDGSRKGKKRKSSQGGRRGGGKRRKPSAKQQPRLGYSYNVEDRKAWRKRQVGLDGLTDEERWETRIAELQEFKRVHGHVNVPQKWHQNQKLANWLKNVRQRWTHVPDYLTPDKAKLLADLGVKKCEPLDAILAKPSRGKSKRRSRRPASSGEEEDSSSSGSSKSSMDGPSSGFHDTSRGAKSDTDEPAHKPYKRRRRSADQMIKAEHDRDQEGGSEEGDDANGSPRASRLGQSSDPFGVRRSGRKRKPLFDLEAYDLVN